MSKIIIKVFNLRPYIYQAFTFIIGYFLYYNFNDILPNKSFFYAILIILLGFESLYYFKNILIVKEDRAVLKSKLGIINDNHIYYQKIENLKLKNNIIGIKYGLMTGKLLWILSGDTKRVKKGFKLMEEKRG